MSEPANPDLQVGTVEWFLASRLESTRGEAQYALNLLPDTVMLGSLKSALTHACEQVLRDVATKQATLARLVALTEERDQRRQDYSDWVSGNAGPQPGWKFSDAEIGEISALNSLVCRWLDEYQEHADWRPEWVTQPATTPEGNQ